MDLFFPQLRAALVPESVEFLTQEFFLDPLNAHPDSGVTGQKRVLDLAAKVQVQPGSPLAETGQDLFFIIHVDPQATRKEHFNRRMFRYFSRLHDRYDLPVYPIALFTFATPRQAQPSSYRIAFPGRTVLEFHYEVVQLNRLSWRDYLNQPNPVACALMAKMQIATEDRAQVKFECLRLLATLQLDEGRWKLISSFVDAYLPLDTREESQFREYVARLQPETREDVQMMTTSWKEEGRVEGRLEGVRGLVERQLTCRLGGLTLEQRTQVQQLALPKLEQLSEDLLDFTAATDLEHWFQRNP
ncbi:DUF4351 domain-containing protein [Candidatus Cyanaurora vandensis]|uniref:DUF4351 domain-containing protein n=1 Tax=Candidatus Cyanaurora vandensis TaxID=2714958 RepID=UPI002580F68E|nr:DUF4351 domain-containing protein [Candidatus Cyanaurora vandensis]